MAGRLLIRLMLLAPCAAGAAEGHCSTGESIVFSCWIGQRAASVCAARDLSANRYVEYRFGRVGREEIVLPADRKHPGRPEALVYVNQIGDPEGYLSFPSGSYRYVIYHFSSQETPVAPGAARNWQNWDGVLVEKRGKTVAHLRCEPDRGVVVNFDPAKVYPAFGLPDRAHLVPEDPLLRRLESEVTR